jgi:hypothetical protein
VYKQNKNHIDLAGARTLLGIALIGQGDLDAARAHIVARLKLALKDRGIIPLGEALLGVALLQIEQGQILRSRQLYELAWRQRRIHNSAVHERIAGARIREVTADLASDYVKAIAQEAAGQDIWEEAAALLEELTNSRQVNGK